METSGPVSVCAEILSLPTGNIECDLTNVLSMTTHDGSATGMYIRSC